MIQVQHLRKLYGELVAVDDASFSVEPGGFSPARANGAGKSTTIGCISGCWRRAAVPSRCSATTSSRTGQPPGGARHRAAGTGALRELSATENLRYWGAAYSLTGADLKRRVTEVLEVIGLLDRAREPVKKFSGG